MIFPIRQLPTQQLKKVAVFSANAVNRLPGSNTISPVVDQEIRVVLAQLSTKQFALKIILNRGRNYWRNLVTYNGRIPW